MFIDGVCQEGLDRYFTTALTLVNAEVFLPAKYGWNRHKMIAWSLASYKYLKANAVVFVSLAFLYILWFSKSLPYNAMPQMF